MIDFEQKKMAAAKKKGSDNNNSNNSSNNNGNRRRSSNNEDLEFEFEDLFCHSRRGSQITRDDSNTSRDEVQSTGLDDSKENMYDAINADVIAQVLKRGNWDEDDEDQDDDGGEEFGQADCVDCDCAKKIRSNNNSNEGKDRNDDYNDGVRDCKEEELNNEKEEEKGVLEANIAVENDDDDDDNSNNNNSDENNSKENLIIVVPVVTPVTPVTPSGGRPPRPRTFGGVSVNPITAATPSPRPFSSQLPKVPETDGLSAAAAAAAAASSLTSPAPPPLSPKSAGKKICLDDFDKLHLIGEGGFGKVYLVRKKNTNEIFALKSMRKDFVLQRNVSGTKAERAVLERLDHPFIVRLHYAFQTDGRLFLVMDYVSGGQILTHMEKQHIFNEDVTRFYCAEIALALKELHSRNIIHRDLKPENILLSAEGHIVVTDFGCSKDLLTCDTGRADSFVGTDMYMAPEQITASDKGGTYGCEVDWWALGCLAWEMLTGTNPFEAKSKQATIKKVMTLKLLLPKFLFSETHSFLKLTLQRDPTKRLGHNGADEVLKHKFLAKINMDDLLHGNIEAPIRPCKSGGGSGSGSGSGGGRQKGQQQQHQHQQQHQQSSEMIDDISAIKPDISNVRDHYLKASIAESPIDSSPLSMDQQLVFKGFTFVRESPLSARLAADMKKEAEAQDDDDDEEEEEEEEEIDDDGMHDDYCDLEDQAVAKVEKVVHSRPVRVKPAQFEYNLDGASVAKAMSTSGPSTPTVSTPKPFCTSEPATPTTPAAVVVAAAAAAAVSSSATTATGKKGKPHNNNNKQHGQHKGNNRKKR